MREKTAGDDCARRISRRAGNGEPGRQKSLSRLFDHFATAVARWTGSPIAFSAACAAILAWAFTGPLFGYSEVWQLVVNTGTTIVTFLMVFLIQQAQNKDSRALHVKLDELLVTAKGADAALAEAENLDDDRLLELADSYAARARRLVEHSRQRQRRDRGAEPGVGAARTRPARRPARSKGLRHARSPWWQKQAAKQRQGGDA
ncbi:low affinity iron permease family protein [Bordetella bronchiseptica]|uniref:low affinity iron permease family protein n=1 Tax=Bordetella bronchiseptica TaxID=518 RepID=UPI00046180F2|nr:low affinity iron permease family protein [Bordetella bronchiseptica]KDD14070.1 low affinity iron permease [Bordetella bronchiseptica MBORD707]